MTARRVKRHRGRQDHQMSSFHAMRSSQKRRCERFENKNEKYKWTRSRIYTGFGKP